MNVFDCFNIYSVISVSYLCALIAIYLFARASRRISVEIQIPDILFVCYFLWSAIQKHPAFNISQLGDITMLLLYLSLRQIKKINYEMAYRFVLTLCGILSGIGYLQYLGILSVSSKAYRISGPFYNPAPYGASISILLSVIIVVLIQSKSSKYLHISYITLLFSLPALLLSESRAAWFSLIVAIAFTVIHHYKYKLKELPALTKKILGGYLFFLILSICILLYHIRPDSVKGRILIWKISTDMIQDSPVKGFGYNGFEANYMNYQARYFKQSQTNDTEKKLAGNVVSAYNEPIRIIVEYGIIGLILYISYVISILILYIKKPDLVSQATVTIILTYMFFGLFSYPNRIFLLQIIPIIATACLLNNNSKTKYSLNLNKRIHSSFRYFVLSAVILFIPCISKLHLGYIRYQTLLKSTSENSPIQLKRLEQVLSGDALFLLNYCIVTHATANNQTILTQLNKAIELSPSSILYRMKGDCLYWMNEFEKAEQSYWIAHYMVPAQQRSKYKLILLYLKTGKEDSAKKLGNEIINDKTKVNNIDTYVLHQKVKKLLSIP